MEQAFHMSSRKSITGLHITLIGDFDQDNLNDFSTLINEANAENSRIFLDVRQLHPMNDAQCLTFKGCYAHVPSKNVYFKGEQGMKLGHQGNRILYMKEHSCKCDGACKACACKSRVKNRNEKFEFIREKIVARFS